MTKEAKILVPIALLLLAGFIFLIIQGGTSLTKVTDKNLLIRDTSHIIGKKDAKVVIVEFGDYQCPACGLAHPIVKKILGDYTNNPEVTFVFRNFPLPMHQNALAAAEAAEAAGTQGKFWEVHDLIYEHQADWENASDPLPIFTSYATQLGLNGDVFTKAVKENAASKVINDDLSDGQVAGVNATPTFYINGEKIEGVLPLADFEAKINSYLK